MRSNILTFDYISVVRKQLILTLIFRDTNKICRSFDVGMQKIKRQYNGYHFIFCIPTSDDEQGVTNIYCVCFFLSTDAAYLKQATDYTFHHILAQRIDRGSSNNL